jgi:hypothetical protein
MKRRFLSKVTSVVLTVAMILSMGATMSFATDDVGDTDASSGTKDASGWWTDSGNYDTSWYTGNESAASYTLSDAADLAGLAYLVNRGNTFTNKTIILNKDIDLSAHYWTPIGGDRGVTGGVPTGYSFAGTFNGGKAGSGTISNYSVTGLEIPWNSGVTRPDGGGTINTGTSYGALGLFGKATGTIENVTVSGSITSNAPVSAVGGVVGYTTGSLYNCTSNVTVNCSNAASAQIGGVVGEVYNHAIRLVRNVQYCANTGAVTGGTQVGGIMGEADCYPLGGIVIDRCANTGDVTTTVTSGEAYVGGIVGFSEGFLTNSYNISTITSNGGSCVAGLVGELRAQNPEARVNNCYTIPVFKGSAASNFSWIYGTVNNSNSLPVKNVIWCEDVNTSSSGVSGISQTIATGNNKQGSWTETGTASEAAMKAQGGATATVYTSTGTDYTTDTAKTVLDVLGSAFVNDSDMNNGYPVLTWQKSGVPGVGDIPTTAPISSLISGSSYNDASTSVVYTIFNETDMNTLAGYVSAGKSTSGVTFAVMNDISLGSSWNGIGTPVLKDADSNSPYVTSGYGFAGALDGGEWTISVDRTISTASDDMTAVGGVINYLAPGGELFDMVVEGKLTVQSAAYSSADSVGGVVGYNCGIIDNVTANVEVVAGTDPTASANGSGCYNVGGITGFNDNYYVKDAIGVVRNCRNTKNVTAYQKVGGIAGENAGLIASCSNSGQITPTSNRRSGAGGITGRNGDNNTALEKGVIWCCMNTGNIYSGETGNTDTQSSWVGGIAGFQNEKSTTANCYNSGNLRAYGYAGYMIGSSDNSGTTASPNYRVSNCFYASGISGTTSGKNDSSIDGSEVSSSTSVSSLVGSLNSSGTSASTYGTWKVDGTVPGLNYNAVEVTQPAEGWASQPKTVYLNPKAASDGDGTQSSPYKDLDKAVTEANGGTVYIMNTVTLTGGNYYYSVTFKRDTTCTGPMFSVNAPADSDGSITYVTFTSATIDGNGTGTLIEVVEGRLRMRGNLKLQNATTGVTVEAKSSSVKAQVEVDYVNIGNTVTTPISVPSNSDGNNSFILNSFGTGQVTLSGTVKLGTDAYITVYNTITDTVNVECTNAAKGRVIASGVVPDGYDYTLTDADAAKINCTNKGDLTVLARSNYDGSEIILDTPLYLDVTASSNGDGTQASPFNTFDAAVTGASAGDTVIVTNAVTVPAGSYDKNLTFKRGTGLTATTMFTVNSNVTLSGISFDGNGIGTVINLTGGALTMTGKSAAVNGVTAIDVASGAALTVTQASVRATQYSIKLADSTSTFNLTPSTGTSISGTVYLGKVESAYVGAMIRVGSSLSAIDGVITIECEYPSANLAVATVNGYDGFTTADLEKITYVNSNYIIAINPVTNAILILANN